MTTHAQTQPSDEEIEAIRGRVERDGSRLSIPALIQSRKDRATLLSALEAERAVRLRVEAALKPFAQLALSIPHFETGVTIGFVDLETEEALDVSVSSSIFQVARATLNQENKDEQ